MLQVACLLALFTAESQTCSLSINTWPHLVLPTGFWIDRNVSILEILKEDLVQTGKVKEVCVYIIRLVHHILKFVLAYNISTVNLVALN